MIDFSPLYEKQKQLDLEIASKHGISYDSTRISRTIALLVEIGEFANETRAFKYWSNKGPSPKNITIEEYVDALHFYLSLGISDNNYLKQYVLKENNKPLNEKIMDVYSSIVDYARDRTEENYINSFLLFLDLGRSFGFSEEEIVDAYYAKLKENHSRQENNY